ncbi:hypothetical protein BC834DRAFT_871608 [Gloeopeniophorella convolvens]|nr:hypothetical protein BC834DRAFT_871608 [Gloeopeniophorella convolvens]
MFSLPQGDSGAAIEGSDDEHPIVLEGTTILEFDSILQFFYFGCVAPDPVGSVRCPADLGPAGASMHSNFRATLPQWLAMLAMSTRLFFDEVRARSIAEITARLDEMDPFDRRIVTRAALVTEGEARSIPFSTTIMLVRSRERVWKQGRDPNVNYGWTQASPHHVDLVIDEELREMRLWHRSSSSGEEPAIQRQTRMAGTRLR